MSLGLGEPVGTELGLVEPVTTERDGEYWVAELGFEEVGFLQASQEEGEEEEVAGP